MHRRASRSRPGRSARASATPSAWRSPSACLRARFNRPASTLVDHRTFAICCDGDLMEGVSARGRVARRPPRARRAVCIYDDNHITIDGPHRLAFSEDVAARFAAYGWHVQQLADANDLDALARRPRAGRGRRRPAVADPRAHAHRLRRAEQAGHGRGARRAARRGRGRAPRSRPTAGRPDQHFYVPDERLEHYRDASAARRRARARLGRAVRALREAHPELAAELERVCAAELPRRLGRACPTSRAAKRWPPASRRAR